MGIQSSPEIVRDMKKTVDTTKKSIDAIRQNIRNAKKSNQQWNDEQGMKYQMLMQRIEKLLESPSATLNATSPKLENLAKSLDNYKKIKF